MEISYEPNRTRPQTITIYDEDILGEGSVEDAMFLIESEVKEHFNNNMEPDYDERSIRAQVEKLFAEKSKEDE